MDTAVEDARAARHVLQSAPQQLDALIARLGAHFATRNSQETARAYVGALLGHVQRKNCWQMAEAAGLPTPYDFQYLLSRARWDVSGVRDQLQRYIGSRLGRVGGALVIDETGFPKKGDKSAGVQLQYCSQTGQIENCQVGVFLSYGTAAGHTLLDRELYIPAAWYEDKRRRREAGIPDKLSFHTKPHLARLMLQRTLAAGWRAEWVVGDEVYGNDGPLRMMLAKAQQPYVFTVRSSYPVVWADASKRRVSELAQELPARQWRTLSAGVGAKGPRYFDWAVIPLAPTGQLRLDNWLLLRRELSAGTLSYFLVGAPAATRLEDMVFGAGQRWSIEECLETGKQEFGLDDYEVRTWEGWYRHVTLAMLAQAFALDLRLRANEEWDEELPKGRTHNGALRRQRTQSSVSASRRSGSF